MRIARLRTIRAEAFDQTDATRESDILILFLGSTNSISPSLQLSAVANLLNAFPADLRGFSLFREIFSRLDASEKFICTTWTSFWVAYSTYPLMFHQRFQVYLVYLVGYHKYQIFSIPTRYSKRKYVCSSSPAAYWILQAIEYEPATNHFSSQQETICPNCFSSVDKQYLGCHHLSSSKRRLLH